MELHKAVHGGKYRQHIGKTVSAVYASSDGGQIPELHADNGAKSLPHGAAGVSFKPGVKLKLSERSHTSDYKFILIFLDIVKPKIRQVYEFIDIKP